MLPTILRTIARRPGPGVLIVTTLAVAIAAATITYSVIDLLRHALPLQDDSRFAFIASTDPRPSQAQAGVYGGVAWTGVSIPDLADFATRTHTFEQFTGFSFGTATWIGATTPERLRVASVTANLLGVWGLHPVAGRAFDEADGAPGAAPVVLVTRRFWKERFGASSAIGRELLIDSRPTTVIGVLPPAFDSGIFTGTDVALPIAMDPSRAARDERRLFVMGLLKPGATREQGGVDLERVVRQLQHEYPRTNAHTGVVVRRPIEQLGGTVPMLIVFLWLIAAALIAIACANLSNIVLAVVASRRREFAIRRALGASWSVRARQLGAEALVLGGVACPFGILLAWAGLKGVSLLDAGGSSPLATLTINGRVVLAAIAVSLIATAALTAVPAFRSGRASAGDLQAHGRDGSRPPEHRFFSHVLVAIQVAVAVLVLVQITSVGRAALRFVHTERGFDEHGLLTLRINLDSTRYDRPDAVARFASDVIAHLSSLPGITSAGIINRMPIADREFGTRMTIAGTNPRREDELPATLATVTADYLRTMRIPVLRGRAITTADVSGRRRVVLVSTTAARRYWPGQNAVGTRIIVDAFGSDPLEIVGIAGDVRNSDVDQGPAPQLYVPFTLQPSRALSVVVRTTGPGDPADLVPAVRRELARIDNTQPAFDIRPMTGVLFEDNAGSILVTTVLAAIGLVALLLAVAGVYGLVSYGVGQRTHEIGIRMALGARPRAIMQMVLRQGARPVVVGALLGAIGAFGLALVASAAMNDVNFRDPLNYAVVIATLVAVAILSSYIPARRAARVDPTVALHAE
jgi:predicted permease